HRGSPRVERRILPESDPTPRERSRPRDGQRAARLRHAAIASSPAAAANICDARLGSGRYICPISPKWEVAGPSTARETPPATSERLRLPIAVTASPPFAVSVVTFGLPATVPVLRASTVIVVHGKPKL